MKNDPTPQDETTAIAEFKAKLDAIVDATPKYRRPSKLARAVMRTAVEKRRGPTSRDLAGGKRSRRSEPDRGPCEVFDRGRRMSLAIMKASRRGRAKP